MFQRGGDTSGLEQGTVPQPGPPDLDKWLIFALWAPFGLEITRHVGENEISTENEFKVR
jgi:hypothetical protein